MRNLDLTTRLRGKILLIDFPSELHKNIFDILNFAKERINVKS